LEDQLGYPELHNIVALALLLLLALWDTWRLLDIYETVYGVSRIGKIRLKNMWG
jgi:hypothetical protein